MRLSRTAFLPALAAAVLLSAGSLAQGELEPMVNVFPDGLRWANPGSIPKAIELAVVYGDPGKPGPYVFRARMPAGTRLPAHRHPDARWVTVLEGTYRSAVGERFDVDSATEYPRGSFYVTAPNAPHYSYAVTDVIVQEQGVGPTGIAYVHSEDDPRHGR